MNAQTETDNREPSHRKQAGRWRPVVLSLLLLGGLAFVLAFVFREQLTPAVQVETGRVILLAGDDTGQQATSSEQLLFQASGWLEPDPWPTKVAVLTDGFVEKVFVREGDTVTNGQALAILDQQDARLAVRESKAAVDAATARVVDAKDTWDRIKALPDRDTTASERVAAKSGLQEKEAQLEAARADLDTARLTLERTEIHAPMDGIVLKRYVDPGSKRARAMDDPNSAAIVSLYDPASLQVRVDVPLAEAGRLAVGQPTRISTAMLPGMVFTGRVTRIVGEADLQRNTLQAKVEVANPDSRMRPEVLCRVEFRGHGAGAGKPGEGKGSATHTLWIPEAALKDPSSTDQEVWVINPVSNRAERRNVKLGPSKREGYRRVLEGLRANETVVTDGVNDLKVGSRVRAGNRETVR